MERAPAVVLGVEHDTHRRAPAALQHPPFTPHELALLAVAHEVAVHDPVDPGLVARDGEELPVRVG